MADGERQAREIRPDRTANFTNITQLEGKGGVDRKDKCRKSQEIEKVVTLDRMISKLLSSWAA